MKKKIFLLIMVFVLCINFVACNKSDDKEDANKEGGEAYLLSQGGNINLPLTPFKTFNPILNDNLYYFYFKDLIYSSLLEINDDSSLNNLLASSVEKINDRTYRIKLREGIKFHNGKVLSADDVIFSYNYILNNKDRSFYYNLINDESNKIFNGSQNFAMNRVDNNTIEVRFASASKNNLYKLTFPIISSADDYKNYTPNGTGPFKFKSYENNKTLILEKNKSYFNGQASIDTVTGIVIDNPSNFEGIFETGKLDIYTAFDTNYSEFLNSSKYAALEFPSNKLYYIGFNYKKNPSLDLRKVIEASINKDIINKEVFSTNLSLCQGFYPEESVFGLHDIKEKEDLSKLSVKKNENHQYVDENNKIIKLNILYNKNDAKKRAIANIIYTQLDNAGFKVEMLGKNANDISFTENYDIYVGEYLVNNSFDLNYRFSNRSEANFTSYSDDRYEALLNNLYANKIEYKEINNFLQDEKIYIPLGYEKNALVLKENMIYDGKINFQNVYSKIKDLIIVSAKSWYYSNLML